MLESYAGPAMSPAESLQVGVQFTSAHHARLHVIAIVRPVMGVIFQPAEERFAECRQSGLPASGIAGRRVAAVIHQGHDVKPPHAEDCWFLSEPHQRIDSLDSGNRRMLTPSLRGPRHLSVKVRRDRAPA